MTEKLKENNGFSLVKHPKGCINEAGRNGATNTITALDITAYTGGRTMPVEATIPTQSVPSMQIVGGDPRVGLTPRMRSLLHFIESYAAENMGVMPSFDNMREAMGLRSKSGVHRLVCSLEARGYLTRRKAAARAMALSPKDRVTVTDALMVVLSECVLSQKSRNELSGILSSRQSWQSIGAVAARLVEGGRK